MKQEKWINTRSSAIKPIVLPYVGACYFEPILASGKKGSNRLTDAEHEKNMELLRLWEQAEQQKY